MTDRHADAPVLRRLIWLVQAWAARSFFVLVRFLPYETASNIGGFLARVIGPHLSLSNLARKNLRGAFPDKTDGDIENIVVGMWDNLGRSAFEFPHFDKFVDNPAALPIDIVGADYVTALRDDGKPGLLVTGHFANWEIGPLALHHCGLAAHAIYRAPNNPYMQPLFERPGRGGGGIDSKGAERCASSLEGSGKRRTHRHAGRSKNE